MKNRKTAMVVVTLLCSVAPPVLAGRPESSHAGKPLSHWIKELKKGDAARANEAIRALAAVGAPAVPDIMRLLADKKYSVRTRAAGALFQLGPAASGAAPSLIAMLGDPSSGEPRYQGGGLTLTQGEPEAKALRVLVITTLARLGDGAAPALVVAVKHSDQLVRLGAVQALEIAGSAPEHATEALLDALKDEHPELRASAGRVLARKGPSIVAPLVALLAGGDVNGRRGAMVALGELGAAASEAVPALLAALRDRDQNVRMAAPNRWGGWPRWLPQASRHSRKG